LRRSKGKRGELCIVPKGILRWSKSNPSAEYYDGCRNPFHCYLDREGWEELCRFRLRDRLRKAAARDATNSNGGLT
jgi:hypothetical protein